MNFDKNTVIGIILIILIFVGFSTYITQQEAKYEKEHPKKTIQTSIEEPKPSSDSSSADSKPKNDAITAVSTDSAATKNLGCFSSASQGTEQLITIENESAIYTLSNKGGIIKKVVLKGYQTFNKKPLVLFENKGDEFNFSFISNDSKSAINTGVLYFNSAGNSQKISGKQKADIIYKIDLGNGKYYAHHYIINGNNQLVGFTIEGVNMADVIAANTDITFNWIQNLPSQEGGIDDQRFNSSLHYMNNKEEEDDLSRDKEEEIETPLKWVSYKQKFFNTSIIALKDNFKSNGKIKITTPEKNNEIVKTFTSNLKIPFNHTNSYSFPMQLFMGANKFTELKATQVGLDKIIPLGGSILGLLNKFFIIPVFQFFSKFISNYGVIILILALVIKLVTFPFTYKSTLSMIKMKVLKPELDELKKKYPSQAEYGQKQMELYSQTGVSPFGGCLPMLLQMPILIAMYRFFPASIELRQQPFLWATDLSSYDAIIHWSQEIPLIGNHISLFTILMAISSIVVTKITSQSQPSAGGDDMMAQQMKIMQYVMPIMLLFMFNKQPAALSYYYFLFNILTIAQNWIIQEFIVDESQIRLQIEENKKKPPKKSAFQEKMQEMMKQQQELKKGK